MRTLLAHPRQAETSDSELMSRSLVDAAAFTEVVGRHVDAIFRFVAARVGPVHAEDVVAETFATAFDKRASFDLSAGSARPWLYGIAANHLNRHREAEARWLRRASLEPISAPEPEEPLADARADAERMAPHLARAIESLRPEERDVLLLFALEELTHEQIARALGIRRGTAKTHLSRGRARLRAHLTQIERGDEQGGAS